VNGTSVSGTDKRLALFIDFENIALGVREAKYPKFDINLVLERLLEKGKIIVKRAYADWERYSDYKRPFHEAAIEMMDIPQKYYSGKNSADIKMVVDAMDIAQAKEHINTFVIASGDSDFSPLVSKLKENDRYVIGVGVKNSSSELLIRNCDEFIFYEDLVRQVQKMPKIQNLPKRKSEAYALLIDAVQALLRENKDVLWSSMIKETMKRKRPSFDEGYHGYDSFSQLLEDAQRDKVVQLKRDQRSGTYVVTAISSGLQMPLRPVSAGAPGGDDGGPPVAAPPPPAPASRRRGGFGRGPGGESGRGRAAKEPMPSGEPLGSESAPLAPEDRGGIVSWDQSYGAGGPPAPAEPLADWGEGLASAAPIAGDEAPAPVDAEPAEPAGAAERGAGGGTRRRRRRRGGARGRGGSASSGS